ncbi:hypothetical protein [Aneurinibacillus soli]|nr:hypothetical protein [Aneurinibacillus soli]
MYTFYQTEKVDLQTRIDWYSKQWKQKSEDQNKFLQLEKTIQKTASVSAVQKQSIIHTNSSSILRFLDLSERLLQVRTEKFRIKTSAPGQNAYDIAVYGTYSDLLLFTKNLDAFRTPYTVSSFRIEKKESSISNSPASSPAASEVKIENTNIKELTHLLQGIEETPAPMPSDSPGIKSEINQQIFMEKMLSSRELVRFSFSINFQVVPNVPDIYPADKISPLSQQTVKEMKRSRKVVADLFSFGSKAELQVQYIQRLFAQELEGK